MPASTDIGSLISIDPAYRNGRPCIAGTGVSVKCIAVWHRYHGMTPEEIAGDYPHITLAQVHAALAYYYSHPDEIEQDLAADDQAEAEYLKSLHGE